MKACFKSMKKLLLWFAFGACVCLVLNGPAQSSPSPSQPSAQLNSANPTAAPVIVPEPSPKAVSFYHSIMLLIAVIIVWSLLVPVGFLFPGVSAQFRTWCERLGRGCFFSHAMCWIWLGLICSLMWRGGDV